MQQQTAQSPPHYHMVAAPWAAPAPAEGLSGYPMAIPMASTSTTDAGPRLLTALAEPVAEPAADVAMFMQYQQYQQQPQLAYPVPMPGQLHNMWEPAAPPAQKRRRSEQPPKQGWTRHEDATILQIVSQVGTKWSAIAAQLPGRSNEAVRMRYTRIQKELMTTSRAAEEAGAWVNVSGADAVVASKRGDMWTASEDEAVLQGVQNYGLKWELVAGGLSGRSANAVRNRYLRIVPQEEGQVVGGAPVVVSGVVLPYPADAGMPQPVTQIGVPQAPPQDDGAGAGANQNQLLP